MTDASEHTPSAGADAGIDGEREALRIAFGESDDIDDAPTVGKPDRCDGRRSAFYWQGERYHLHVDFYPGTAVVFQVWAYGPKYGTDRYWELQDLCIGLSKDFQSGTTPEDLSARVFRDDAGNPQALTGAIADQILDMQTEYADAMG